MLQIRSMQDDDWSEIWAVLEPTFRRGETYAFRQDITQNEAYHYWVELPAATFVAQDGGPVLGTYYIKPNQPGAGSHVCNCGYVVAEAARGQGIASAMCQHSQEQARALGFRAMQYNLVVASNTGAVQLWQRHGFEIVGTLPGAFKHPQLGYVDAYVMFRRLVDD